MSFLRSDLTFNAVFLQSKPDGSRRTIHNNPFSCVLLGKKFDYLFGRNDKHAEHQVQEHLFAATDSDRLSAV